MNSPYTIFMNMRMTIIVIVCLLIIGGIGALYYVSQPVEVEPDVNTNINPVNLIGDTNTNTDDTDTDTENSGSGYTDLDGSALVEYDASMGEVCPIDVAFVASKNTNSVDCACPDGYEKTSTQIGGESCYDGAECPIFSVQCEPLEANL